MQRRKSWFWDKWRSHYTIIIPMCMCFIYLLVYILIWIDVLDYSFITGSSYFTNMLESIITFTSIVMGVFGVFLPVLIQLKEKSAMMKYFIESVDKKTFGVNLKLILVSGFITVFLSCMLYLYDIFSEWFLQFMIVSWIWVLFYFMSISYRFISLFIRLLLEEKKDTHKRMHNPMSDKDSNELKSQIKAMRQ